MANGVVTIAAGRPVAGHGALAAVEGATGGAAP